MSSILDMIKGKIIHVGDTIEFKFKGHYFLATIQKGGLISNCFHRNKELKPCLKSVIAFTSLTAWTEACLQDVLEEYYTRYSSWKRVIHKQSGLTMGELRDRCKLMNSKIDQEAYKEILRLTQTVSKLKNFIVSKGFKVPKWENDIQSVIKKPLVSVSIRNKDAFERIQRIMINKPNVEDNELYALLS